MNKKIRKQRLWKVNFRRQYQQRIIETLEKETGLPADCLCVFIAKMAEKLSGGRLTTKSGILAIHARKDDPPLLTAHRWNLIDGQIFDLSPLANGKHRIEYFTEEDGEKYRFYRENTIMFSKDLTEADVETETQMFLAAFAA